MRILGEILNKGLILLGASVFLVSCGLFDIVPPITEAQREEMQSRQWETSIADVHKASVFVLRGLGYRITSSPTDKTFVEAKGLVRQKQATDDCRSVWDPLAKQHVQHCQPGERYQVFRRASLTMERIGDHTHLRLIVVSVNSRYGDRILTNNALYEQIFGRIEERLFVRNTLK